MLKGAIQDPLPLVWTASLVSLLLSRLSAHSDSPHLSHYQLPALSLQRRLSDLNACKRAIQSALSQSQIPLRPTDLVV